MPLLSTETTIAWSTSLGRKLCYRHSKACQSDLDGPICTNIWWFASHLWHGQTSHVKGSPLVATINTWCNVTRTNIIRLFHCLWSSIVAVYYWYQVWQGSDCVPAPASHQKQTQGLVWFAGWFPIQLLLWRLVGGKATRRLMVETTASSILMFQLSYTGRLSFTYFWP